MSTLLHRLNPYRFLIVLGVTLVSLYPVWQWYISRLFSQGGEPWSVLPLLTVVLLLWLKPGERHTDALNLVLPALLMLLYMLSLVLLPPIFRAALAMMIIANLLCQHWYGKDFHLGLWSLMGLALPVVASLQFYLGYPMRALVGDATSLLLGLNGLMVVRDGTVLRWGVETISIDAPCSGIKLMWVGLYMVFTLACFYELTIKRTAILMLVGMLVIFVGNVLRSTSLFYTEVGLVPSYEWMHEAIGLVAFAFVAVSLVFVNSTIDRRLKW